MVERVNGLKALSVTISRLATRRVVDLTFLTALLKGQCVPLCTCVRVFPSRLFLLENGERAGCATQQRRLRSPDNGVCVCVPDHGESAKCVSFVGETGCCGGRTTD